MPRPPRYLGLGEISGLGWRAHVHLPSAGGDIFFFDEEIANGVAEKDVIVDYQEVIIDGPQGEGGDVVDLVPTHRVPNARDARVVDGNLEVTVGADNDVIVFQGITNFSDILFV